MSEVEGFVNGENSEASAPAPRVCVSPSDTTVAMVAEFSQNCTGRTRRMIAGARHGRWEVAAAGGNLAFGLGLGAVSGGQMM